MTLLNRIKFDYEQVSLNNDDYKSDWKRRSNKYNCRLRFNNKQMTVKLYMGEACDEPTKEDILHTLCMDDVTDMTFYDFCSCFGYDEYEAKSRKIYDNCWRQSERFYKLFGAANVEELKRLLEDY